MPRDPLEAEKRGTRSSLSPSHHLTTSSVGKIPSPMRGPYPQTSEDEAASDAGPMDSSLRRKGEGAGETEVAEVVKAQIALIPPSPPPPAGVEGKRKMDFLAKSKSQSLVGKRAT